MTDHLARINEAASRIAAIETLMTWSEDDVARWVLAVGDHLPDSPLPEALLDVPVNFPAEHMPWLAAEMARRVDAMLDEIRNAERARLLAVTGDYFDHLAGAAPADPCAEARESVEGACPAEDVGAAPAEAGDLSTLAGRIADRAEAERTGKAGDMATLGRRMAAREAERRKAMAARAAERREAEQTRDMCS